MSTTNILNITLSRDDYADYIESLDHIGAFMIIIRCENLSGTNAIFHISASQFGQSRVKRTVSSPGSLGEELSIEWPDNSKPILRYESPKTAPIEEISYNLKIT
jgi:hypothetical protein